MENFETITGDKHLEHIGGCVGIMRLRVISESSEDRFYHWWDEDGGLWHDQSRLCHLVRFSSFHKKIVFIYLFEFLFRIVYKIFIVIFQIES
jgi:hypothetical protein